MVTATRRLTKHRHAKNRIDYGSEDDWIDLAACVSEFSLEDGDFESRRREQIAYLARYAPGLMMNIVNDAMPVRELDEWAKAVSGIVQQENSKGKDP